MRGIFTMVVALLYAAPVFAQESADVVEQVPVDLDTIVKALIALAFAWLVKRFGSEAWMRALIDGLKVGVNDAWDEYVKARKVDADGNPRKLAENEKETARNYAVEKAKRAMGILGRIALATTPASKVKDLIGEIVRERKQI